MSTDIAQFLWVEGSLSIMEQLCLNSFLRNGYEVHLYTYKPVGNIPDGVVTLPAVEILPDIDVFKSLDFAGRSTSYTALADLFRLELLYQRGGWWFDMDMICLQHMLPPVPFTVASTWEGEFGECACNCAIWGPKGDSSIGELRHQAMRLALEKRSMLRFGEIGIFLLQSLIKNYSLERHVAPWWEFCPYPWRLVHRLAQRNAKEFIVDRLRDVKHRVWQKVDPNFKAAYPRSNSRTIHFHNEIWKASNLPKDEAYFPLSPVEVLKRRYLN